jgi:hypothetical protein
MPTRKPDDHTTTFLRIAAAELRDLASRTPEIATELRHVAERQCYTSRSMA